MSPRSPDDCLLEFVSKLPQRLRSDLWHAIVIHMRPYWVSIDDPRLETMAAKLMKPRRWERRFKNAVVVAGVIDHVMNTLLKETLTEALLNVDDLERRQWQAARVKWLALREGELSPSAIDDLDSYGGDGS